MVTVVNSPNPSSDKGGNSFLVGVILVTGFVGLLLYFGIPALQNMDKVQVNVPAPQVNVPTPQVNVQAPQEEASPSK